MAVDGGVIAVCGFGVLGGALAWVVGALEVAAARWSGLVDELG